jgi:hypothetical protein
MDARATLSNGTTKKLASERCICIFWPFPFMGSMYLFIAEKLQLFWEHAVAFLHQALSYKPEGCGIENLDFFFQIT